MKVVKIDLIRLAMPFHSGRAMINQEHIDTYNAADATLSKMEALLIKITTDTGLIGWGESFGHLINPVTFCALEGSVGRFFLGKEIPTNATDIKRLMQQAQHAFHGFGNSGPVMYALSGIDIALWDLLGKIHNKPLYQLLNGQRKEIGVYASLVRYGDAVDQHVVRAYQEGFRKIKLHEIEDQYITKARQALPKDAELMVDVNCPWTLEESIHHANQLKHLNLTWLEEPLFPPSDVLGLKAIRKQGVPIAAGENVDGVQGFEQHFINQAIDYAQPSVAKIGGITAMLDVFTLANKYNVNVVPHCFYYGAGLLATAHLLTLLPKHVELEIPYIQWSEKLYPEMDISPRFTLKDTAGLGFSPDMAVFNKYTIAHATINL